MLIDWIHWFSSIPYDQLLIILLPVLLFDVVRYCCGAVIMFVMDGCIFVWRWLTQRPERTSFEHCPSVCLVIAGLNEGDTIGSTLASVWNTYPRMEIIVVDDGSTDGMADVAQVFANNHEGVLVLRKPQRGGKSSALNFAIPFTTAEIIVCVDGDSQLSPGAIWEIVQPFSDPTVGAVSGAVLARNPFVNLATWLQASEYLHCIFLGRMFASRIDILGIISGAFGAYRHDAIARLKGWDVGPGEDGDLTLRLRKARYRIVFAPYAQCLTNLPTSFWRLIKQRRRWEWAAVTFECRKHVDLGNPFSPNFRWSNLLMLLDRWVYNVALPYVLWGYAIWLALNPHPHTLYHLIFYYFVYVAMDLMQLLIILFYSNNRWQDFQAGLIAPLSPIYYLVLKAVALWALTEELISRRSFRDGFVPEHVRRATWHW